ncbi:hypothetical protein [Flectobacillus longus]|uniref:hypothetical protein n=1 Tax=Flectobacillus longus TaxID=2984207 RepID=UPI0024B68A24|nr:hypothetical protein [Flectobacillus longus]MDI9877885.1 hypothetical protein [Flectobacillus longus]
MKKFLSISLMSSLALAGITSCQKDENGVPSTPVVIKDYSVNPSLVTTLSGFDAVKINTLISSDDKLTDSPNFVFGAQPDGAGLMKNPSGEGFILINNHEIIRSVSRVYLDKTLKPTKGEYILDGDGGTWRLCSATLATPEIHGFGPMFLTAGESGAESLVHGISPLADISGKKDASRVLPALGKASMENAVPLPKEAFAGKTVIIIGEDDTNGQLVAYVSNTVGDLNNGKLYFLKRTNNDPIETNIAVGQKYDVEFVEIENAKTLTGAQIAALSVTKNAIQFARVEDVDYGKGSASKNRDVYFTATGVSQSDKKSPVTGKTMWGRVYHLALDANNPLKGTLEALVDGVVDPGNSIVNPDNICVTENYVYIQEDGDSFYADNKHDGRVWQYNIATKALKPMIEMNHRRTDATFNAKYNPLNVNTLSSWEYGAMYDISDLVGIPGTFLLNVHPHTWRDMKYSNPDGSNSTVAKSITDSSTGSYAEGGQVVILSGVPR